MLCSSLMYFSLFLSLRAETRESFLVSADYLIQQSCGSALRLCKMQKLMMRVQDEARAIRSLQEEVPKLKEQLSEAKGIFKGRERKALTEQIQQTEKEISERLDKLPDILREAGYPDVQAFMATYRKAEIVVSQYNRDLARWEQEVQAKKNPPKPPEKKSVRDQLRRLQEEGRRTSRRKPRDYER